MIMSTIEGQGAKRRNLRTKTTPFKQERLMSDKSRTVTKVTKKYMSSEIQFLRVFRTI